MPTGQHPKHRENGQPADDGLVYLPPPDTTERKEVRVAQTTFVPVGPAGGEGVSLVITPIVAVGPGAWAPCGVQVVVPFDPDGWESFKETVANDGRVKRPSGIEVARSLPPEPKH